MTKILAPVSKYKNRDCFWMTLSRDMIEKCRFHHRLNGVGLIIPHKNEKNPLMHRCQ